MLSSYYEFVSDPNIITLFGGKTLLMVHNYTFHKIAGVKYCGGIRWQCSSRKSGKCNAFLVVSEDEKTILRVSGLHNHDPPVFHKTQDGIYVKVK